MELTKFQMRRSDLLKEIYLSEELYESLCSAGCISHEHRASVQQRDTDNKKIARLLDIMESRSFAQYTKFLSALRETSQDRAAEVLKNEDDKEQLEIVSGENTQTRKILIYRYWRINENDENEGHESNGCSSLCCAML